MDDNGVAHDMSDFSILSAQSDDGYSDSEWLDIASNRESDDNDSVSSRDSDAHGGPSLPLSRRSSLSIGSSRDGDNDAWEGFTDDSSDEGARQDFADLTVDGPILSPIFDIDIDEQDVEEHRLRNALDQSMISTLGSSRTSSHPSTAQNSIRDLRLSFPDPLTSSRDELSASYDNVASPEQSSSLPEFVDIESLNDGALPINHNDAVDTMKPGLHAVKELGLIPTPVSPEQAELFVVDYAIRLFGTPSSIKWAFVQDLLRSSCSESASGLTLVSISVSQCGAYQWLHFNNSDGILSLTVQVEDKTLDAPMGRSYPAVYETLGIIYLPCHHLPKPALRMRYIPVEIPDHQGHSDLNTFWATQGKQFHTLLLSGDAYTPVVRHEDLPVLKTQLVHLKMSSMTEDRLRTLGSLFVALLVGIYGVAIYFMATGPSVSPTLIATPSTTQVSLNTTFSLALRASTSIAIVPQAYPPAVHVRETTSSLDVTIPPEASSSTICKCDTTSWTERMKSTKDLIIPPTASILAQAPAQLSKTSESISSLSIRAIDSLSQIVDVTLKALIDSVSRDVRELMDALDELSRAISRQTEKFVHVSKSTSNSIRDLIRYRHERAKGRAMELKESSGHFVSIVGDALMGRTTVARQKAHSLRNHVISSDAWKTYRKAHGDWTSHLGGKYARVPPRARKPKKLFGYNMQ